MIKVNMFRAPKIIGEQVKIPSKDALHFVAGRCAEFGVASAGGKSPKEVVDGVVSAMAGIENISSQQNPKIIYSILEQCAENIESSSNVFLKSVKEQKKKFSDKKQLPFSDWLDKWSKVLGEEISVPKFKPDTSIAGENQYAPKFINRAIDFKC